MQIRVFGHINIERDGQSVVIATRPRLVLAMLADRYGQLVSDDALVECIWPDQQPSSARQALQGYVLAVRDVLDPSRPRGQAGNIVRRDGDGYWLDVGADALDLARVDELDDGPTPRSDADLDELLDVTSAAPFGEFSTTPWAASRCAWVAEARRRAFIERFEIELDLGTAETQLARLHGATREFPYDERLASLSMIALYRNRRQADALAVFDATRRRLVDELGVSPGTDLMQVHTNVLQQSSSLDAPQRSRQTTMRATSETPSELIDREEVIADIVDAVVRQRVVSVTGPGGVGKTVVLAEVVRSLAEKFSEVVHLDASNVAERGLIDEFATAVGVDQHPLVETSASVKEALSGRSVLIVVDTCEVAVRGVADVIDLALAAPNVHMVLGSRVPINHRLERRFRLGPLSQTGAIELLSRAGFNAADADGQAVAALVGRLDGLPLAVEMVAHRVVALGVTAVLADLDQRAGALDFDVAMHSVPPRHRSLDALVGWSLESLDSAQRSLVVRCAALGGDFPIEALTSVEPLAEVPNDRVTTVLAQLIEASVVERSGDAPATFRLFDTVADVVRRVHPIETTQQRGLFDSYVVAQAWADYTGAGPTTAGTWVHDRYARTVDHLCEHPDARVVMLATAAARSWLDGGALDQGRRTLGRALDLVPRPPPALASIGWAILGYNQLYQGDIRQALVSYRSSLEHVDSVQLAGMKELISATVLWLECDFAASWAVASSVIEAMTTTSRRAPGNLIAFAKYALFAGDLEGATDCYERAVRLARVGDDSVAEANAIRLAAVVAAMRGDHDSAVSAALRSVTLHDASASTLGATQAASTMALVATLAGDESMARSWTDRALERALRQFDVQTACVTLPIVSWLDARSGDVERAARLTGWIDHFLADQRHVRHPSVAALHSDVDAVLADVAEHDRRRWFAEGAALRPSEVLQFARGN